ncbi:MAG TPA: RHS repeat-associated core domain-containing protein [Kofleriaceae bacterium]
MVLPLEGQVGVQPGSGSVAADGSYHYDMPLVVPPGRRGMAPKLSLSYSSRGGNGLLGIGWQLGGLSPVRRCDATIAYDGLATAEAGDYDLCWEGRHILRATDGTYRFEGDNSTQITTSGSSITFALSNGTKRVFSSVLGSVTLNSWQLVQDIDADGNSIDYSYDVVSAGELYPLTITYTNRSSDSGKRTIKFGYGRIARPDPVISYRRGVQYSINRLLTTIECDAPNPTTVGAVSSYSLTYSQSLATRQSRLVAVDHTGADGNPQVERTFAWNSTGFVDYDATDTFNSWVSPLLFATYSSVRAVDLDGNGQDEMLVQTGQSTVLNVGYSSANGWFTDSAFLYDDNFLLQDAVFGDFDGDGKTDLIAPWFATPPLEGGSYDSTYKLFQWQGPMLAAPWPLQGPWLGSFAASGDFGQYYFDDKYGGAHGQPGSVNVNAVADLDGDGLVDLVQGVHADPSEPGWGQNEPYYPAYFNYKWKYRHNSTAPGSAPTFDDSLDVPFTLNDPIVNIHAPLAGGTHPTFATPAGGGRQALYFSNTWNMEANSVQPCLLESYDGVELDPTGTLQPVVSAQARPQSAYGDLNGDGEADFVDYDAKSHQICVTWGGAPDGTPQACLTISVSDSTTQTVPATCSSDTPETVGPYHLMVYDMDGDGREDVALVHDADTTNNIPSHEAYRVWFDATNTLRFHTLKYPPLGAGDFDGDGRLDVVVMAADGEHFETVRAQATEDTIGKVGDRSNSSTNTREIIGYSSRWAPYTTSWPNAFWAPGTQGNEPSPALYSCTYPQKCIRSGIEVATYLAVVTGDDPNAAHETFYSYADPRVDMWGRGFLGFGYVDAFDIVAMHETVTRYDRLGSLWHVDPLERWDMTPIAQETWPPPSTTGTSTLPMYNPGTSPRSRVVHTAYVYDNCGGSDAPEAEPNCVNIARTDEWEENLTFPGLVNTPFPALSGPNGAPTLTDPGVTLLRTRFAQYTRDHYGNVTVDQEWTVGGQVSTTTTMYYAPDLTNWLVALPKSITSVVACADSTCTATSDGTLSPTPRRTDFTFTGADVSEIDVEPTSSDLSIRETTTFVRNSDGSVTSITRSAPGQTSRTDSFTYDTTERMFVTSHTNALGQREQYLFHPGYGALVSTSDVNNVVTSFQVDELGNRRSVIPSGAAKISYSFLPRLLGSQLSGTIAKITSADGASRTLQTDCVGHLVSDSHVGFSGVSTMQVMGYDAEGRLVSTSRPGWGAPGAAESTQLYDTLDRPYTHTDAAGGTTTYAQSFASTQVTDPASHISLITRDVDDRPISSTQYLPGSYPLLTTYHYGDFGELLRTIDPNSNTISTSYDQRGRRLSVTSPDSGTSSTQYDAFDNVTATAEGASTTSYVRDLLGRPTQATNADGTASYYWDATNGIGKPSAQQSPDGTYHSFVYDTYGRMKEEFYVANGQVVAFQRTFDSAGRLSSLIYPTIYGTTTGLTVGYSYNSHGFLSSIARTDSGSTTVYWQTQSETVDDIPDSFVLGNGITGNRTYDPAGRPSEVKDTGLTDLKYTYTAESALATQTDLVLSRTDSYTYDALHRLTQWKVVPTGASTRTMSFSYDSLGNLLSEQLGTTTIATYMYGGSGAGPHAPTYASTTGTIAYDARGRQVSTPTRSVTYTERDLPKTVTIGGDTTTFGYDVDGSRVVKKDSSGWTMSVDGLWERRSDSSVLTDYYYVRGPGGAVAQATLNESTLGRSLVYIHHDVRGTPIATSNASGTLVRRLFFDPWGHRTDQNAVPVTGTDATMLFGLDELRYDDELGLVNQRGRSYDPTLRHFLTADPVVGAPFDSQTYNRYSYIYNNPINLRDPSGFDPWDSEDEDDDPDVPFGEGLGDNWLGPNPVDETEGASGGGGLPADGPGTPPPPPPNTIRNTPTGSAPVTRIGTTTVSRYGVFVPGCAPGRGACSPEWYEVNDPAPDPMMTNPVYKFLNVDCRVCGAVLEDIAFVGSIAMAGQDLQSALNTFPSGAPAFPSFAAEQPELEEVAVVPPSLPVRAEELWRQSGSALDLPPIVAKKTLAISVGEPTGEAIRIINVTREDVYDAIASGRIPLAPGEILGSPRYDKLHAEILGARDGSLFTNRGGSVGTWPKACDRCGSTFFHNEFPGWTHVNPDPFADYANTPPDWFDP